MPTRFVHRIAAAVASLVAVTGGATMAVSAADAVDLRLTGEEGVKFEATCELTRDGATETARLAGAVPAERRWQAEAISCRIRQTSAQGHLQVELTKGGNRTRSRTSGQGSTLSLSVR
jgi:hypothetical protein